MKNYRNYKKNSKTNTDLINNPKCNCGSYAFNLVEWFLPVYPDVEEDEEVMWENRHNCIQNWVDCTQTKIEAISNLLEEDVGVILSLFPEVQRITWNEVSNIPKEKRLIAYRLMVIVDEEKEVIDTDFHFKVRINGRWSEKSGSAYIHSCSEEIDETMPWVDGELIYEGPIAFFIMDEPLKI